MRALVVAAVVLCAAGCHWVPAPADIPGTYTAVYPFGKQTLTLARDGTYTQEITIVEPAAQYLARGEWTFDQHDGYVTFDFNFIKVFDMSGERAESMQSANGWVIVPSWKSKGTVTIELSVNSPHGRLVRRVAP